MRNDSLGDRMKEYENVSKHKLIRRTPIIGRIDGKAFHTYTHGMIKPFDKNLMHVFWFAAAETARQIQNCKLLYHQSDEVSFLLVDYEELNTEAWFGNSLQKLASVSASLFTYHFNKAAKILLPEEHRHKVALFDSRWFNIPKEEVMNYFIWRQQDATRNSVRMAGHYYFSHRDLDGINNMELQDMLFKEHEVNWNDYPTCFKRGIAATGSTNWEIDTEIPIFTQDRSYVEKLVLLN